MNDYQNVRVRLQEATGNALAFLLHKRNQQGWWQDFLTPAGVSDAWVTAFVGTTLASLPANSAARRAAYGAWHLLAERHRTGGGWGYHTAVPADADTTLWALQLAAALAIKSPQIDSAYAFLQQHLRPNGGIATYATEEPIRAYIGLPPEIVSFAGWCAAHTCVTAAAATLPPLASQLSSYLRATQRPDGRWCSYWWFEHAYSTALAATALAANGKQDQQRVQKAVTWASHTLQKRSRTSRLAPFALAWILRTLILAANREQVQEACLVAAQQLLQSQRSDGAWPSSAKLRVPRPDIFVPELVPKWVQWHGRFSAPPSPTAILNHTFNLYSLDQNAVFTTAVVVQSLHHLQAWLEKKHPSASQPPGGSFQRARLSRNPTSGRLF